MDTQRGEVAGKWVRWPVLGGRGQEAKKKNPAAFLNTRLPAPGLLIPPPRLKIASRPSAQLRQTPSPRPKVLRV